MVRETDEVKRKRKKKQCFELQLWAKVSMGFLLIKTVLLKTQGISSKTHNIV